MSQTARRARLLDAAMGAPYFPEPEPEAQTLRQIVERAYAAQELNRAYDFGQTAWTDAQCDESAALDKAAFDARDQLHDFLTSVCGFDQCTIKMLGDVL